MPAGALCPRSRRCSILCSSKPAMARVRRRMICICALLAFLHAVLPAVGDDRLIGWQGQTYFSAPGSLRGGIDHMKEVATSPWMEVLSWSPRAFVFHNFLTPKECLYLIHQAAPSMVKSTVVDSATGGSKDSRVRTSSGTFLRRGQDDVISRIEKRIADYTFIPASHGEGFQVLHYQKGQKYEAHYDYFHDTINTRNGGQRIATLLMYLSDVEEGGETVFPAADANPNTPGWNEMSECGKGGVAVRPKRGDALLFWSLKPDATLDPKSLHAGCPVIRGNKWSATKWMRVQSYG